jgi:hypothetical protein
MPFGRVQVASKSYTTSFFYINNSRRLSTGLLGSGFSQKNKVTFMMDSFQPGSA